MDRFKGLVSLIAIVLNGIFWWAFLGIIEWNWQPSTWNVITRVIWVLIFIISTYGELKKYIKQ
jgi:uncharacterized membrane protein